MLNICTEFHESRTCSFRTIAPSVINQPTIKQTTRVITIAPILTLPEPSPLASLHLTSCLNDTDRDLLMLAEHLLLLLLRCCY